MPEKARLQHHFFMKKLASTWHQPVQNDDLERRYYVTDSRGKQARATSNEYFVSQALDEIGLEYAFQLSIDGGKQRKFGIVLDFLVDTKPLPTPVWVHGEHWHTGSQRQEDLRAQQTVDDAMRGEVARPLEIWGNQSNSKEMALQALKDANLV